MEHSDKISDYYKTESPKMVSVICKYYGFPFYDSAEEIVNETFLNATIDWKSNGVPENPIAWLYAVARNKAKNISQRESNFQFNILPKYLYGLTNTKSVPEFSEEEIVDSQILMIFAISHPIIPVESQIGLALRILCGFSIEDVALAFFTNKETINKRLYRAKEILRENKINLDYPSPGDIVFRLNSVLRTLYFIFNKGYSSNGLDLNIRKSICLESIRLCGILLENKINLHSDVYSLLSIFYFQYSRFDSRVGNEGEMVIYAEQNREIWNQNFIKKGEYFFHQASKTPTFSKYQIEANISYLLTLSDEIEGKWQKILDLYTALLHIEPSTLINLNRTYALYKVSGSLPAIKEMEKIESGKNSHYYILLGELYFDLDPLKAQSYFLKAISILSNPVEINSVSERTKKLPKL
ncbi:RNA polymerase sigma factor [Leptospira sp. WS39.C2]